MLENIAHGLVTDRRAQMLQGTDNPVIPPGTILLRHADHEVLQILVNLRAPWSLALLGSIKFLRHHFPVPRQHGVGCDNCGDFR